MLIADLHIHSRYSRATSREITVEGLYRAAQLKGIGLLGSGDITHPAWFDELSQKLQPTEDGRYILKPELSRALDASIPAPCQGQVSYVLSGEISCIYKKNDKTRKIHCLVIMPNLEAAARLNQMLDKIGNIKSDGRPILGLDARDLLEICLTAHPETIFIPAHIWTPWFSLFGSKSGFNHIQECFADLTPHISALETGLSSDPAMNWQLSALDNYTLVSNSDAHSLETLAREANLLNCDPTFAGLRSALQGPNNPAFVGTIEFFPDEGKYHLDGHRACGVRLSPQQSNELNGICPVCQRPLTIGVLNRVEELADRPQGYVPDNAPEVESLTSLNQTLGQTLSKGAASKAVAALKEKLLNKVGNELYILRQWPLEEAARMGGELLAEGLRRLRAGEVILNGGYDGVFGSVELFNAQEREEIKGQLRLLARCVPARGKGSHHQAGEDPATHVDAICHPMQTADPQVIHGQTIARPGIGLDDEQLAAVRHNAGHALVSAGPGAGKTRVLVERVNWLLARKVPPASILVITFTRKAAAELKQRLPVNSQVKVTTFHGLGFELLGRPSKILDEAGRLALIKNLARPQDISTAQLARVLSLAKQNPGGLDELEERLQPVGRQYTRHLRELGAVDMDDLVWLAHKQVNESNPAFQYILVDEYQDVNPVQVAFLRALAGRSQAQVFAIGDPRQAIYGFRGADSRLFQQFVEDFAPAATYTISRNYRSQAAIISLAGQLLNENDNKLQPVIAAGEKPEAITLNSPQAEANFIAQQIVRLTGGVDSRQVERQKSGEKLYAPREIAVLYRLHQQAPMIQQALDELGVPVQTAKDVYLRELEEMDFTLQKVNLMTMHAAKGLEFPVVFVCGLEDGLIPYHPPSGVCPHGAKGCISVQQDTLQDSQMPTVMVQRMALAHGAKGCISVQQDTLQDSQMPTVITGDTPGEESNLLFVALTRAQERLFLSRSQQRVLFGQTIGKSDSPLWLKLKGRHLKTLKPGFRPRKPKQIALFQ